MSISIGDQTICKYNLRGMCRFGQRCRNVHENPELLVEKLMRNASLTDRDVPTLNVPNNPGGSSQRQDTPPKPPRNQYNNNQGAISKKLRSTPQPSTSRGTSSSSSSTSTSTSKTESEEKTCGICFDVVLKKVNRIEQTFGLLPNCNHVYCFACIRKWRQSKEFEFEVSKSCPECRIASDFVYPSKRWIEKKEDKENYIQDQKNRMKKLNCKYYRQGKGMCPFGNLCLYLHALPNGKVIDVGPPKPRRRAPAVSGEDLVHQILFWLSDEGYDLEDSDDSDDDEDDYDLEFELDLEDPCIAVQYYGSDDIRRYLAWDRLFNCDNPNGEHGGENAASSPPLFFG